MLQPTNTECVSSGKGGRGCYALINVDRGCMNGTCPFFKTEKKLRDEEDKSRRRCGELGIAFRTREEILDSMNKGTQASRERYEKERKKNAPKKVLQYNTYENEFIEHASIGAACLELGLSMDKLELLIEKGEKYNGYNFVYI